MANDDEYPDLEDLLDDDIDDDEEEDDDIDDDDEEEEDEEDMPERYELCGRCHYQYREHSGSFCRDQYDTAGMLPSGGWISSGVVGERSRITTCRLCNNLPCQVRLPDGTVVVNSVPGMPGVIDPASIVIPPVPDPTEPMPEPALADRNRALRETQAALYFQGAYYQVYFERSDNIEGFVKAQVQARMSAEMARFHAFRQNVERLQAQLQAAITRVRTINEVPHMEQRHAAVGLRVWKEGPNTYGVEKFVQWFPQAVTYNNLSNKRHTAKIALGQFTPKMLVGYIQWVHPGGAIQRAYLVDPKTGKRFWHYHARPEVDCLGDLPKTAATYDDLLKVYQLWEQQLQVVNLGSLGMEHPEGLPHANAIRVEADSEVTPATRLEGVESLTWSVS